ncbi:MAG: metal ABC transporter substrate-binding protein [Flavonifractor plautii]
MKNLKEFLVFCLSTALSLSLLAACGKPQTPMAGAETPAEPSSAASEGSLRVMASFYPMYDFAQKIGGDKVTVTNMVPAGTEPHDWEPSPSDIVALEQADVFVYSGAGMEHWVEDVLASLDNQSLVTVEASYGIALLEGHHHHHEDEEEAEHEHEDEHEHEEGGGYDPHVWLSPLNAKREMENIKNAIAEADPANAEYYEANYAAWSARCDQLDQAFKDGLSNLAIQDIVVSHEAFGYLCDAYGLNQVGIEGISPDSEPDPARMAQIQDFVTEHQVKVIFSEELVSPKVAQAIADATGARVETLSPLEGLTDEQLTAGEDYFSVMEQSLASLKGRSVVKERLHDGVEADGSPFPTERRRYSPAPPLGCPRADLPP